MLSSAWLEAFIAFAEHLNFTHAAAALHLSQPALHVQIGKLSEAIGVPLYQREGRRLELTAAGIELLAFAREERERSARVLEELRTGHSALPVRLSAGSGAYLYLLGPAIREFRRRSASRLALLQHDQAGTIAALRSGSAHLGIATLDGVPDGLDAEPLLRVPQVLVLPRRHALARKRSLRLADLSHQPLIVPPEGRPQRAMLSQALLNAGVPWRVAVEATGWHLVLHFVGLGLGLTVVNGSCKLPPGLVARPLGELPEVSYFLLSRAGAVHRPEVALLQKILREHVAAPQGRGAKRSRQSAS